MSQREKLIELLDIAFLDSDDNYGMPKSEQVADILIANGVVVLKDESALPCWACNHGWGIASADGIKTCEESCLELREYAKQKGGE